MNDTTSKKRLGGRGLDGLFGGPDPASATGNAAASATRSAAVTSAAIEELHPNKKQPRTRFEDSKLEELAQSIRELGVLEPILVRKRVGSGGGFEIIAGERRWRAAQRAGLREVPIFVRELSEQNAFEAALVENLQREDLNPIEVARAYQRLVTEHGLAQEDLAKRVGKDRSSIANSLRLLKLPEQVLGMVESGELSEGHGRALLGAEGTAAMLRIAREAAKDALSVREVERRARSTAKANAGASKSDANGSGGSSAGATTSANVRDLETRLTRALGTKVTVADRKGKGHLQVAFSSYDELDRLIAMFGA